ncbi:MAG: hypothetical protein ACOCWQ_05020 [Nanoarchaeota archaeon]
MRVSIIGAGDRQYHFGELLGMDDGIVDQHLEEIAEALAKNRAEVVLLPDRGVCVDLARHYRQSGGISVIATVPLKDEMFGISHLQPYREEVFAQGPLFTETVDTGSWFQQDAIITLLGDVVLMLGVTLGSLQELTFGLYLYKLFVGQKGGIEIARDCVHPQIRAGESFRVLCYRPFMRGPLNEEIEAYATKIGVEIIYIDDAQQLADYL